MDLKIGDIIEFGHYAQKNCSESNDKIEWIVLGKEGTSFLVISRYALDCVRYNDNPGKVTWETCSLRTWLNGEFINKAFTSDEQKIIETSAVPADRNPLSSMNPGKDTEDRVFLLSTKEVKKYLKTKKSKQCRCTDHAVSCGAFTSDDGNGWWWLRSPGFETDCAARVFNYGEIDFIGGVVHGGDTAVRPAVRITPVSEHVTVISAG